MAAEDVRIFAVVFAVVSLGPANIQSNTLKVEGCRFDNSTLHLRCPAGEHIDIQESTMVRSNKACRKENICCPQNRTQVQCMVYSWDERLEKQQVQCHGKQFCDVQLKAAKCQSKTIDSQLIEYTCVNKKVSAYACNEEASLHAWCGPGFYINITGSRVGVSSKDCPRGLCCPNLAQCTMHIEGDTSDGWLKAQRHRCENIIDDTCTVPMIDLQCKQHLTNRSFPIRFQYLYYDCIKKTPATSVGTSPDHASTTIASFETVTSLTIQKTSETLSPKRHLPGRTTSMGTTEMLPSYQIYSTSVIMYKPTSKDYTWPVAGAVGGLVVLIIIVAVVILCRKRGSHCLRSPKSKANDEHRCISMNQHTRCNTGGTQRGTQPSHFGSAVGRNTRHSPREWGDYGCVSATARFLSAHPDNSGSALGIYENTNITTPASCTGGIMNGDGELTLEDNQVYETGPVGTADLSSGSREGTQLHTELPSSDTTITDNDLYATSDLGAYTSTKGRI